MQVTQETGPQPRLIAKLIRAHQKQRHLKQLKRIEQHKEYMAKIFQRQKDPFGLPPKKQRYLSTNAKLFIASYLMFAFAFVLFFLTPGQEKQLLGYQFYHISTAGLLPENHNLLIVKRAPFITYSKDDIVIVEYKNAIPQFDAQRIQTLDVANYTLTMKSEVSAPIIPKEQIKGKVITSLPNYTKQIRSTISILLACNGLLVVLFLFQLIREIRYYMARKNKQANS